MKNINLKKVFLTFFVFLIVIFIAAAINKDVKKFLLNKFNNVYEEITAEKIERTIGQRESGFLIKKINKDSVEGLFLFSGPVVSEEDEGGFPVILKIGDRTGGFCEGGILKLKKIDYDKQLVIFKKAKGRNFGFNECPICLSGKTLIDTPSGQIAVKNLKIGMAVWTVDKLGNKVLGNIEKTSKTPVSNSHKMVNLVLKDGRELFVSYNHPTVNKGVVGSLSNGDKYDGSYVISKKLVPYDELATYDILPSGDTGFYLANGILLGSTLK